MEHDRGGTPSKELTDRPQTDLPRRKHVHRWRIFGGLILLLIGGLAAGRALLPSVVRESVNRALRRSPAYIGKVGEIQLQLLRGAYSIRDIHISKLTGNIPDPLFAAKRVDFAIQWNALLHRRIVGRMLIQQPEINFVDAPNQDDTQTGSGGPWLEMIRELFPFTINSAVIRDGSIHFRTYQAGTPVNVFISHLQASIDDLGNIYRETKPLVTSVQADGKVMDQAKFEFKMALNPFSYRPTFHMALRLLGLDVTKLNELTQTYGKFDFKGGWFDLVVECEAREGQLSGYVKPLFRNLKVFSLKEDFKDKNVFQFFWQALIGATTRVLTNPSREQFGTLINFSGDASGPTSDILGTIGNVLRNAFIRAYLPQLEGGEANIEGLHFAPADLSVPISVADGP